MEPGQSGEEVQEGLCDLLLLKWCGNSWAQWDKGSIPFELPVLVHVEWPLMKVLCVLRNLFPNVAKAG